MEKTNAVTQAAKNQGYFLLTLKLRKYKSNTNIKYAKENCEKKILIEIGMGMIKIKINNAKGNKTNMPGKRNLFKRLTEEFIPSSPIYY